MTNEPGYYETGKFGIRIENVMLIKSVETPHNFGSDGWMAFETVIITPFYAICSCPQYVLDYDGPNPEEAD
jgi:Xaa-Pro aminopeptidase